MAEKPTAPEPAEAPVPNPSPAPDSPPPGEAPEGKTRRASQRQQKRRRSSVFQYIAILFAAAFVLLLFTYVMERRQNEQRELENQEQMENLDQERVSAVQTLQGLYDENDTLKAQVEELEKELAAAHAEADDASAAATLAENSLTKTAAAMDWFWQLDEAYVRGRTSLCRQLLEAMEADQADPLTNYLPRESVTDTDRFSPYDRYMEIREKVL